MTCTHLIDPMSAFCRCALDPERDHCGVYSELCHGNNWPCYADLGPWGAWRSISGWITAPFVTVDPEGDLPWVRYGVLSEMPAPPELFAAVGWSP